MRYLGIAILALAASTAQAGLLDDISAAVSGHIDDFKSRSGPDQVLADATVLKSTRFRTDDPGQDLAHRGEGGLSLVEKGGVYFVQLAADVEISFAPDLVLYVSNDPMITDEGRFEATTQIEVGPLVKGKGASFYALEGMTEADVLNLSSATVWCQRFGEFMASADW